MHIYTLVGGRDCIEVGLCATCNALLPHELLVV
jgi:hypothetical protein